MAHCLPDDGDETEDGDEAEDTDEIEVAAAGEVDDATAQCVLESLPDIVGSPHAAAVVDVVANGIAEGKADGSYEPQEAVTRGQMATFLDRALDLALEAAGELPEDAEGSVHEQAIEAVIEHNIALGFEDGDFRPGEAVTRGQMASFLDRALEL